MTMSKTMAHLNRAGLNRIARRVAPRLPGFGVVVHRGRRSQRRYETPVNVFPTSSGFRIALTYGADSDWVKNVLAANGCTLKSRGHDFALTEPRINSDPTAANIRPVERQILRLMRVTEFLDLAADHNAVPVPTADTDGL